MRNVTRHRCASHTHRTTRSSFLPLDERPLSLQYSSSSLRPHVDQLCTENRFTRFGPAAAAVVVVVVVAFAVDGDAPADADAPLPPAALPLAGG